MIPVSFDGNNINDGTNYESLIELDGYGLPLIDVVTAQRQGAWPLVSGVKRDEKRISLQIFIRGASVDTLRKQLFQYFDYEDEIPKKLIVEDTGGGNDRYVMAICRGIFPDEIMPETCYHIALVVDGDVMFRETTPTAASSWSVTATGQTKVVANNGEMDCYPIIKIKPTAAKTGSWPYKRFMEVNWRTGAVSQHPVDIANNGLDTQIASTNFALANGNDLRLYVNGIEVDRWLDGPNTATTKVWVNLDFEAAPGTLTISPGIGSGDTTIYIYQDISGLPSSGIVEIGGELIVYGSKSNADQTLLDCSRGAKGTTAAAHGNGTGVYWIQHEIWIVYGNASAGAPTLDNDYKPMFDLATSTNASWDYNEFWDEDAGYGSGFKPRSGSWLTNAMYWYPEFYGGNHGAAADPAIEIGIKVDHMVDVGVIYAINPCGILSANFVNGEKYAEVFAYWPDSYIVSKTTETVPTIIEYTIPAPSASTTWQAWSQLETLLTGSKSVGISLGGPDISGLDFYLEAADVTLALNTAYGPLITIGSEQTNYSLDAKITNNTTGDAIELLFVMELNVELEVDTNDKTIIYLDDNSNQFQALMLSGGPRRDWLPLQPGNNTLQYDENGVNGVTVSISYEERFYQ